jgi:hypothetical protein
VLAGLAFAPQAHSSATQESTRTAYSQKEKVPFGEGAPGVLKDLAAGGWVITPDDLADSAAVGAPAKKIKKGTVAVRNLSSYYADIYVSLNDATTPWYLVDTLAPRRKLSFKLNQKLDYLLAAEATYTDQFWDWGPAAFYLKSKFTWTITN